MALRKNVYWHYVSLSVVIYTPSSQRLEMPSLGSAFPAHPPLCTLCFPWDAFPPDLLAMCLSTVSPRHQHGDASKACTLFTAVSQHPENCPTYTRHSVNICGMTEEPHVPCICALIFSYLDQLCVYIFSLFFFKLSRLHAQQRAQHGA